MLLNNLEQVLNTGFTVIPLINQQIDHLLKPRVLTFMFPTKSILTGANTVGPSLSEKRESMVTFADSEIQTQLVSHFECTML